MRSAARCRCPFWPRPRAQLLRAVRRDDERLLTSRSETVPSHRVSMMGGTQTTGSVTGGTARSCRERSTSSGTSDSSAVHFVLTRASSTEDGDAANEADGKAVEAEAEAARAAEAAEAAMLGRRLPVASWLLNAWSSSASIDAG